MWVGVGVGVGEALGWGWGWGWGGGELLIVRAHRLNPVVGVAACRQSAQLLVAVGVLALLSARAAAEALELAADACLVYELRLEELALRWRVRALLRGRGKHRQPSEEWQV